MRRELRLRHFAVLTAICCIAGAVEAAVQFSEITTPESVIGERRTTAVVHLNGVTEDKVSVYVTYGRDNAGVDARPGTYGTAACEPGQPGTLRCTMIFPHPHHPLPNLTNMLEGRPNEGIVFTAGERVHFRWRKDVRVSFSSELLTLSSPHDSFIMPRRLVVANIGDSYAAGEGAPGAGEKEAQWLNALCHRSEIGGQRQGIVDFVRDNPGIAVHYRNFPCSGATVYDGLIGADPQFLPHIPFGGDQEIPLAGDSDSDTQLNKLANWMDSSGHELIDALFVSIGGNDVGFGTVVSDCMLGFLSDCPTNPSITELVSEGIDDLFSQRPDGSFDGFYVDLDDQIDRRLRASKVFITEYPDPTRDSNGEACDVENNDYECFGFLDGGMKASEAIFAYDTVLVPMNRRIKQAANELGWIYLGDSDLSANGTIRNTAGHMGRSRTRGICNCANGFFNTVKQSSQSQDDVRGSVHPSAAGQDAIYRQSVRTALRDHFGTLESRRPQNVALLTALTGTVLRRGDAGDVDPDEILDDAPLAAADVTERGTSKASAAAIARAKAIAAARAHAQAKAKARAKAQAAARAKAQATAAAKARAAAIARAKAQAIARAKAQAVARAKAQASASPKTQTPVKQPVPPKTALPIRKPPTPVEAPASIPKPQRVVFQRDLSKLPANVQERLRRHDQLLREIYGQSSQQAQR